MENYKIKNIIKNEKFTIIVLIVLLCMSIYAYYYILNKNTLKDNFTNNLIKINDENENPIFKIDKIMIYSSADAIDNTSEQNLQNLSICQYTDIAIYIDNKSHIPDITAKNTIKELYIDNINMNLNSGKGNQILNYKDIHEFGKFNLPGNSRWKNKF